MVDNVNFDPGTEFDSVLDELDCEYDELDYKNKEEYLKAKERHTPQQVQIPTMKVPSIEHIKHIDQKKAYYNFKKCPYYDGFMARWSDCRVCDVPIEDAIKTAGFYMVNELDFSNCKYPKHINSFNCYKNHIIYPHFEIKFMRDIGLKFKIVAGCWGTKMDMIFPEEWIDSKCESLKTVGNKLKGISYYAK